MDFFYVGKKIDLALTFSGSLFLSLALLDIIPEAMEQLQQSIGIRQGRCGVPWVNVIVGSAFLLIWIVDRQISHKLSKMESRNLTEIELKQNFVQDNKHIKNTTPKLTYKTFIFQLGLSLHSFVQCLAIGLQKTQIQTISLSSAIIIHKWAEGLSLGLMYRKQGYSDRIVDMMIYLQGFMNVVGFVTGILLAQEMLISILFMAISAGSFLYVGVGEVLRTQLKRKVGLQKIAMVLLGNCFACFVVWFQHNHYT